MNKQPERPQQSGATAYLPRVGAWQFIPNVGVIVPQEVHGGGEHSVWAYQIYKEVVDRYRSEYTDFLENQLGVGDVTDAPAVRQAVEDFMCRLDAALCVHIIGNDAHLRRPQAAKNICELAGNHDGFRLTEDAAREVLRKAPPAGLIIRLGCRNVRGLLAEMSALDAIAMATCTDPGPYPDLVFDVIDKCARPDWFVNAPAEMCFPDVALNASDEPGEQAAALARLCGRVVMAETPAGDGQFPAISFVLGVLRGVVAYDKFSEVFRELADSPDHFGRRVADSVRGHWGRYVASAYHVFENSIDFEVVQRLSRVADAMADDEAASILRGAAGVYHLSITLPDATFVPLCAATWAGFRRGGGVGVPTPLAARTERDWTTSDFFSLYVDRAGLGGGGAIQAKAKELVASGRQAEDLRGHFFSEAIDPDDLLVRQTPMSDPPQAGRLDRPLTEPLLSPTSLPWESRYVLNAGVIRLNGTIYILYRAFGDDEVSRVGLAWTKDGLHIDGRLDSPIFSPANDDETAGCEDVRTIQIGSRIYMLYTAWNHKVAQIALASIEVDAFLAHRFDEWERHGLAFPGLANKDAALYPERIAGKYVAYHRIDPNMWVSYLDDLTCPWPSHGAKIIASPRTGMMWDGVKIGAGGPPIKTTHGWLNIYHGVDYQRVYRLGVLFMALDDPARVLYRSPNPILEPELPFELGGEGSWVPRVVFTCGAVPLEDKAVIGPDDEILVYYGAADTVIGVAKGRLRDIVPVIDNL